VDAYGSYRLIAAAKIAAQRGDDELAARLRGTYIHHRDSAGGRGYVNP
jgi:hypothetical protein